MIFPRVLLIYFLFLQFNELRRKHYFSVIMNMKKIVLFLFLSYSVCLSAQSSLSAPGISLGQLRYSSYIDLKGFRLDNGEYLICQSPLTNYPPPNLKYFEIYRLTEDLQSMVNPTFSPVRSSHFLYHGYDPDDRGVHSIRYVHDVKGDEYTVHHQHYQMAGNTCESKAVNTFSVKYGHRQRTSIRHAVSEDRSQNAFLIPIRDNDDKLVNMTVVVTDKWGEEMWRIVLDRPFYKGVFGIRDMVVTNQGTVHLCLTNLSEGRLGILSIEENDYRFSDTETDFGIIEDVKLFRKKDGSYFIGGYYSDDPKEDATGIFSLFYYPEEENFSTPFHRNLFKDPSGEIDKSKQYLYHKKFDLYCKNIHELQNGNLVLLGEQMQMKAEAHYDGQRTVITYCYTFRNVFYHQFSPDGDEIAATALNKYQYSVAGIPVQNYVNTACSFEDFVIGNDVYLLFNDHNGNYGSFPLPVPEKYEVKYKKKMGKDNCIVEARIDEDGNVSKHVLKTGPGTEVFQRLLYCDNQTAILLLTNLKSSRVCKLELE